MRRYLVISVLLLGLAAGLAAARAITTSAPVTQMSQEPPPGNGRLIFEDDFNGRTLDRTKWRPNWLGANPRALTKPVSSVQLNCYDPAQVRQADGALQLTVRKLPCKVRGRTFPYRSGLVESEGKFSFTYGYMEARMWLPAGAGMWPAFWSNGQNWPFDGEIDVVEGTGTDMATFHYHHGAGVYAGSARVARATAGWHTYGASWTPGQIRWFFDRRQVGQTRTLHSAPMYLILNLAVRTPPPTVPITLRVDWVRVWQ
jgi:beta-glucanase (GH16 family)